MDLRKVPNADQLARDAAAFIREAADEAIRERGQFTLALAGGSTPEKAYAILAAPDWSKWHLFFGDERFVPRDDERSNFAMTQRSLLGRAAGAAVYPVPTESATPADAASAYEKVLLDAFGGSPRFDLVLLGLGDDGHTASLFPGKPALAATNWVTSSGPGVLPPPVDRVTLTFPAINAARKVLFLVAGSNKAEALRDVLGGHINADRRPAAGVHPTDGTLTWMVDEAAAGLLSVG